MGQTKELFCALVGTFFFSSENVCHTQSQSTKLMKRGGALSIGADLQSLDLASLEFQLVLQVTHTCLLLAHNTPGHSGRLQELQLRCTCLQLRGGKPRVKRNEVKQIRCLM